MFFCVCVCVCPLFFFVLVREGVLCLKKKEWREQIGMQVCRVGREFRFETERGGKNPGELPSHEDRLRIIIRLAGWAL